MFSSFMFGTHIAPRILILGLGQSGLAMLRWCVAHGAQVRAADTRELTHLPELQAQFSGVEFQCGEWNEALLSDVDLIGISPGLSPYVSPLQEFLAVAQQRGIAVWSEIEFFAQGLAALKQSQGYEPRCVGITGTNGKTTVTALCAFLAHRSGLHAVAAGNISPAALDVLHDALQQQTLQQQALPDFWALELSSFQLEHTHSLVLDAAVILNLSADHLDWHPSLQHYGTTKARIYTHAAVRIANRADATTLSLASSDALTFGLEAPQQPGDWGALTENGLRWLAWREGEVGDKNADKNTEKNTADKKARAKKKRANAAETEVAPLIKLIPAEALRLKGEHNLENVLAALALVTHAGVSLSKALYALRDFRGLPHRVEFVRQLNGVDYFDDSKGTNVGATVAALNGLKRRVVLIAGGDGKGQDFTPLAAPVHTWGRAVLLIGRDAPHIQAVLPVSMHVERAADLEQAVQRAAQLAHSGDAVLLSPACASFDMFRDYQQRADVFVAAVHALSEREPEAQQISRAEPLIQTLTEALSETASLPGEVV